MQFWVFIFLSQPPVEQPLMIICHKTLQLSGKQHVWPSVLKTLGFPSTRAGGNKSKVVTEEGMDTCLGVLERGEPSVR